MGNLRTANKRHKRAIAALRTVKAPVKDAAVDIDTKSEATA